MILVLLRFPPRQQRVFDLPCHDNGDLLFRDARWMEAFF
jgi:hypothetical protein